MTEEQLSKISKFKRMLDEGKRISGSQVKELTDLYNAVFGTRLATTSCSSCVRQRIGRLYNQLTKENKDDK